MIGPNPARRPAAADAGVFLGTFALLFLAMGGLFAADLFLAGLERAERRAEAEQLHQEGMRLAAEGRPLEAVDRFQSAFAAERTNPVYQRALAAALLASGKVAEARTVAADRLQHEPTDAAASLVLARALVREGEPRKAVSYYHRAIFGQWDDDPTRSRVRARFELVDLLARIGAQRELLAELLPLQGEAPTDVGTRKRIARLFLDAGSPPRAIEIFRALLRSHGRDPDLYAGLGDAEFARGNYRSARADFSVAARLAPEDSAIAGRLDLAQRVLGLDPTQRGLGSEEQYRRSVALLGLTLASADSCAGSAAIGADPGMVDSARAAVVARVPSGRQHNAVEVNLDLAERLWELRRRVCRAPLAPREQPVALVLEKLAQ